MITRRRLIRNGALAAGAALTLGRAARGAASDPPLPPPLAQLKPRRGEARPITREERGERREHARRLMAERGLDAIVLAEGTSLQYFCGVHWWGSERLFAAVLPARGEPFYVCPAFEEGRAREQLANGTDPERADVRTWQEDDSPYARLAQGLRDRGIAAGRIGLEENVRFVFADGIAAAAPQARLVSATPVTAGCRMIKSAHEIALMRLASEVTLAAYHATYLSIRPGMTQREVSELSRLAHEQLGFNGAADLVLVGEGSAFPHGSVAPLPVRDGTIVLFDGGCDVEGYKSDISRTFVLGKATARMNEVFAVVQRAQAAALAAARPGVECGAVDAAARAVVTAAGFGPDYRYFTHRVGHGLGMDGHEWPYLVRGNTVRLAAGMTTSNEPGIYIRGEFGVRLEDDMLVTESGAELLTPPSRSLEEPFARA
ncbi:MAG TPA: Xaa-Pro peptidase family protein [Steroidobacteraceae bacterium]|nr:Xaa-Pro peptidase family protein [Steroidobacteraceae bacterium]